MENWEKYNIRFRYMLLSRMKQDCDYYLGNGNRSINGLWAVNERDQILNMKYLLETFDPEDAPEWLAKEELLEYARKMGVNLRV